ncbi:exo-alpha-sialidase [uncultured Tessaracoccus sp.]|uniref:exo-alpha-sialidase n=1 Tax=uncultured Tessaracoccus sp. TaxID=905023 RepID=UPI0025E88B0D|nr:exo-alpha-sialidase [uncultured Tessaracoccus sp.]
MAVERGTRGRAIVAPLVCAALLWPAGLAHAEVAPVGDWVKGNWGNVRLTSISPQKAAYAEGDVLRLSYRVEANLPEKTNMRVTSDTVTNAEACNWTGLPAGPAGKYNCGATATRPQDITYTITAEDVAAGEARFGTVWAPSSAPGSTYLAVEVDTVVQTTDGVEERPDIVEGEPRQLAGPGDFGFACHRIPALTEAPNGWLLAAWDGRPGSCQDAPQANSIIQRVSKDGGKSWEKPTTIAAGFPGDRTTGKYGYSDPSYVVDREKGTIFAFFVKSFDASFQQSRPGVDPDQRDVLHAVVVTSTDNGVSWSDPRDITADITTDVADWRSRFAASGEGIQLRQGDHKGRLLQQYTIATVSPATYRAVTVYSDDHGESWHVGTPVGTGMDENKVVELSDGTVMLNSRRSDQPGSRKVALSTDGGKSYGDVRVDAALVDPRNNASIIRAFPDATAGDDLARMLLFSNANDPGSRVNGTVRASLDDGRTWARAKTFAPGSMSYSTLTPLSEPGTYGLLYEGDGPSIQYMQVSLNWLGLLPVRVDGEPQQLRRGANTVTVRLRNLLDEDDDGELTLRGPAHWDFGDPVHVSLPAGKTVEATIPVTVPDSADPQHVRLTATVESVDASSSGTVPVEVVLGPREHPTAPAELTLVGELPAQAGEEPENMFDGNLASLWHTPWAQSMRLPMDVDVTLGDEARPLAYLRQVPRQSGPNGRIKDYEVWTGDDAESLTKVASGTWPNTADEQIVPLTGDATHVRLRVLSTYGDNSGKTFVSIAELGVHTRVPDTEARPATIHTAGTKLVGAPTNAWGAVDVEDGTPVTVERKAGDHWVSVATTTAKGGQYVASLAEVDTPGTHVLRAVVEGEPSETTATLTRIAATTKAHVDRKLAGNTTYVWGVLGGPATVSTQVWVDGRWSTSQRREAKPGAYRVPLTYGAAMPGTQRWRLVVRHADGQTEVSEPWQLTRVARTTVGHASTKRAGETTYVWGRVGGAATLFTQVRVDGRWSTSQVRHVAAGTYTVPLTYGRSSTGTTQWRLVVRHDHGESEVSDTWTLTRR